MAHKVEATLEVEPDLPELEVNANQIKQVFVNLINNAAQAIASDGRSGRICDHRQALARRRGRQRSPTTAPASPRRSLPRVFEPFFTTKTRGRRAPASASRSVRAS